MKTKRHKWRVAIDDLAMGDGPMWSVTLVTRDGEYLDLFGTPDKKEANRLAKALRAALRGVK